MDRADGTGLVRRTRIYRSVAEKRRIVELTLLPGASVSRVAQVEGVNAHQVFDWRRAYRKGRLGAKEHSRCALLPVVLSAPETGVGRGAEPTFLQPAPATRLRLLRRLRPRPVRFILSFRAARRSASKGMLIQS